MSETDGMRGRRKGLWTVLVAVVALLAALVGTVVWRTARTRALEVRRRATHRVMRELATGWELYFVDTGTYCPEGMTAPVLAWGNLTTADLARMLRGPYVKDDVFASVDGWGRELELGVQCTPGCAPSAASPEPCAYFIRSSGRDGTWEQDRYARRFTSTSDYDADIVFSNGQFVQVSDPGEAP
ncbi:MAG: hypothetical protein MUF10_06975 [Thermoanaerobaculaceae bacterium]|jgi:hypothetical protein|nr:hypothetical protein [Thermoanaerobaculaceae bacterium]